MTKTTLAEEEIELKFTHERIDTIEKEIGSFYSYPDKCSDKTVTVSNIVSIYYHAQEGTAYNKHQIFDKIIKDGLIPHITQTCNIIMGLIFGEKIMTQLEEDSKKK